MLKQKDRRTLYCVSVAGLLHRAISKGFIKKQAGTFKKHLAGDWTDQLSITFYHRLNLTNQMNSRRPTG